MKLSTKTKQKFWLKSSIKEMMNELANLENRVDQLEERMSNAKDRNLEMTQVGEEIRK